MVTLIWLCSFAFLCNFLKTFCTHWKPHLCYFCGWFHLSVFFLCLRGHFTPFESVLDYFNVCGVFSVCLFWKSLCSFCLISWWFCFALFWGFFLHLLWVFCGLYSSLCGCFVFLFILWWFCVCFSLFMALFFMALWSISARLWTSCTSFRVFLKR